MPNDQWNVFCFTKKLLKYKIPFLFSVSVRTGWRLIFLRGFRKCIMENNNRISFLFFSLTQICWIIDDGIRYASMKLTAWVFNQPPKNWYIFLDTSHRSRRRLWSYSKSLLKEKTVKCLYWHDESTAIHHAAADLLLDFRHYFPR